jgi:hypothetical protein
MHILKVPYFFFINIIGAPQCETLGNMYPFSKNSYEYIYISFNSSVLILYDVFDTNVAPSIKSMDKYISFIGGKPDIYPNTYSYSCNTGKSSRLGPFLLVVSST